MAVRHGMWSSAFAGIEQSELLVLACGSHVRTSPVKIHALDYIRLSLELRAALHCVYIPQLDFV